MFEQLSLQVPAFGLDISDLSIKIIKLKKQGNRKALASFGEFKVPRGVIVQGEIKKPDELTAILKEAREGVQGERLTATRVVASLPEERAFLQVVQLPLLREDEIQEVIRFQAEKYIPYPLESVYLDYQLAEPLVDHLNHKDVLIAALPRQIADSYLAVLLEAGLTPVAFEVESLAVCRALVEGEISPAPLLLLDIGATRTGLAVFAGKSPIFTSSIPVSSYQLTEAIAKAFGVDVRVAEALKIRYGIATSRGEGENAAAALKPLLSDLVRHVKRYLEYYSSHATHQHLAPEGAKLSKVLLCGGGSLLKGLPEFLGQELGLEVELGNPWTNIFSRPVADLPPLSLQESLRYTTALGLAIRAAT